MSNNGKNKCAYVARPPNKNDPTPFFKGPSRSRRLATIQPRHWLEIHFYFPLFDKYLKQRQRVRRTWQESPFISFKFLMASGLNTENNPNKCEELKIVASSNKIKFWSAAPPRTLNPAAPSPPLETPGKSVIALMTSASPKTTGICLIVEAC